MACPTCWGWKWMTALSMSARPLALIQCGDCRKGCNVFCLFTLPSRWIKLVSEEITRKSFVGYCCTFHKITIVHTYNFIPIQRANTVFLEDIKIHANGCFIDVLTWLPLLSLKPLALTKTQILKEHCHTQHNWYSSCYSCTCVLLLLLLLLSAVTHAPFRAPVLRPTSWPNARDRRDGEAN